MIQEIFTRACPPSLRRACAVLLLTLFLSTPVEAALRQDEMINGGGQCTAASNRINWSAIGEPFAGRMSGGGFVIQSGGGPFPTAPGTPRITSMAPLNNSRFYQGATVSFTVTAIDPENDPLQYRFLADGTILRNWSAQTSTPWNTTSVGFGWHTLRVEVKDATHKTGRESKVFIFRKPPIPS